MEEEDVSKVAVFEDLKVDCDSRRVYINEKEVNLTAAEEKQIKIEKMRRIRDIREQEIDDYNKDKNDDDRLDIDVKDINFLGKIKIEHEVDGEPQIIEMDI